MKILLFFFLFSFLTFGQKISDKEFEKLRQKIENYPISAIDSALTDAKQLVVIAEKSKTNQFIADANEVLAYQFLFKNKVKEALQANNLSLKINTKLKNEIKIANNYFVFCEVYNKNSDLVNALKYALKSLEIAKKYNLTKLKIFIYVKPSSKGGTVKIAIEKNGNEKLGKDEYKEQPKEKEPKYWHKINELYKEYYKLNFKEL